MICCFLAGALLIIFNWSFSLRFALSLPALQQAVKVQNSVGTSLQTPTRVGAFDCSGIYLHSDAQVYFDLAGPRDIGVGLLYEPHGQKWALPIRRHNLAPGWSVADFGGGESLWQFLRDVVPLVPSFSR